MLEPFKARAVVGHMLSPHQSVPRQGGRPAFNCLAHERKSLEDMDTNSYRVLMPAWVVTPFPQRCLLPLFHGPADEKQQR